MIPWIIVGYFTENTLYERKAKTLITTLNLNKVLYYIEKVPNLGSWWKNTAYKPTFLKRMLKEFWGLDIIYVDVDARFLRYPTLFDELPCDGDYHG